MISGGANPLARFDARWRRQCGVRLLGGVDEAGRGALAGPVVAGCVLLAPGARLAGVDDSKLLTAEARETLVPRILAAAADWSLGWASAAEIDRINILEATLLAARRALGRLRLVPELLLTDYLKLAPAPCHVEPLVDGDARSLAIAAASVLAKVARDRIMRALAVEYPLYGLDSNKGYGTTRHWQALDAHGPATLHRLTYKGVCFFNAAPSVRALSHGPALAGRRPPAEPDWAHILTCDPGRLDPCLFLPDCEYDACLPELEHVPEISNTLE